MEGGGHNEVRREMDGEGVSEGFVWFGCFVMHCFHTFSHTCITVCISTHAHTHAHMHTYTHTHTHTHIHTHRLFGLTPFVCTSCTRPTELMACPDVPSNYIISPVFLCILFWLVATDLTLWLSTPVSC